MPSPEVFSSALGNALQRKGENLANPGDGCCYRLTSEGALVVEVAYEAKIRLAKVRCR